MATPFFSYSYMVVSTLFVFAELYGETHRNDLQGLGDRGLDVERQAGIDLGRDLAGDNLQDLGAELNQQVVDGSLDLGLLVTTLSLGGGDSGVNQSLVLGLLGSSQNQRGVGGGILGLVLANGCTYTRLVSGLQYYGAGSIGLGGTNRQSHRSRRQRPI